MKECILLSLMCAMVGSVAGAQSSPPVTQCIGSASLVFSDSVSFFLDAPSGWVLDCKAGKRDGVMTVLYRTGESWRTGQAVMYANVLTPKGSTVEGFDARVRNEVASWSAGVPDAKVTVGRRIPTKAGQSAIVRKFTSASKDLVEIVAYVPTSELVRYAVDLRSMTGGRGQFTVQHHHYDVLPAHLVNKAKQSLPK